MTFVWGVKELDRDKKMERCDLKKMKYLSREHEKRGLFPGSSPASSATVCLN